MILAHDDPKHILLKFRRDIRIDQHTVVELTFIFLTFITFLSIYISRIYYQVLK